MVKNKINLSLNEPYIRQVYAKEGDSGRVYELDIDPTPTENGTLRIKRPDGVEVTSPASLGEDITESGEVVSFDALDEAPMSSLKVGIEPIQDLHGQSNPYPAGGGKNKISYPYGFTTQTTNTCTATVQSDGTITFSGTPSANTTFNIKLRTQSSGDYALFLSEGDYIVNGCPAGGSSTTYQISVIASSGTPIAIDRGSGASFSIPSGGMNVGVQLFVGSGYNPNSLVLSPMIRLASVTDGTFAPYSNICPIYANVGKNLWELDNSYSVSPSGTLISNVTLNVPIPSGTYTFSCKGTIGTAVATAFRKADGTNIATATLNTNTKSATITLTETAYKVNMYSSGTLDISDIQLELGSSATSYVPYNTQTVYLSPTESVADATAYNTTLPQLVYGGTLDVVSGKLTVTHALGYITSSNFVSAAKEGNLWRCVANYFLYESNTYQVGLCNKYVYETSYTNVNGTNNSIAFNNATVKSQFLIHDDRVTSSNDIATDLATTPIEYCYPLATPIEVDLTPTQISTLLGENNLWASCGDVLEVQFAYDGMLSALPSQATEVVGRCIGDVELGGVSTMPFTLVVQKNNQGE